MRVPVVRHAGPLELALQVGLRVVDDDQIGLERQDPLHVRIEQPADPRQALDFRRKPVVVADAGDAVAGAHREQHLGGRRHERDDALRAGRPGRRRSAERLTSVRKSDVVQPVMVLPVGTSQA